jgi:hypothetical protein
MLQGLQVVVWLVMLGCYFFVIYKMFDAAETVIGIVCLVGACLLGLGGIVAFVYGWMKAWEWEIVPVMAIWSVCVVLNIGLAVVGVLMSG